MAGALAFTLDSEVVGHVLGVAEMWAGPMQGPGPMCALTACLCTALHLPVMHCGSGVQHGVGTCSQGRQHCIIITDRLVLLKPGLSELREENNPSGPFHALLLPVHIPDGPLPAGSRPRQAGSWRGEAEFAPSLRKADSLGWRRHIARELAVHEVWGQPVPSWGCP